MQFTGGSRGNGQQSELAIHLVGLADEDEGDGDGNHDDHGTRHETVEEIREGGGHSATNGRDILEAVIQYLGCAAQAVEVCDSTAITSAQRQQLGDRAAAGSLDIAVPVSHCPHLVPPAEQ